MNEIGRKKAVIDICKKGECGIIDGSVFKKGYSCQTIVVYSIIASYNGRIAAKELLEAYCSEDVDKQEAVEDCKSALWQLFTDGFVKLNTLTDEGVMAISEKFRLDKLTQKNNK